MRVLISGRVQGVFFRDSTRREAERLGLSGWVRNLPDGRVEALFEGSGKEIQKMLEWCDHGPTGASVENVDRFHEDPETAESSSRRFEIR